jgi:hypothetical protein
MQDDTPRTFAVPMAARRYVIGHTTGPDDPACPIYCDGEVMEVPPGARLAYTGLLCLCDYRVTVARGDDQVPNLIIVGHEPRCRAYWAMLRTAERRPELDGLAGIAATGCAA